MNNDSLVKLNSKFADERKCKNEKCGGYFLSKEPQDYCPLCREKGFGNGDVEKDKDLVFKEVNMTKLQSQVDDIERRLKLVEGHSDKKKTFKPKKCACGKEFTPVSGNQQLCQSCRDKLIK